MLELWGGECVKLDIIVESCERFLPMVAGYAAPANITPHRGCHCARIANQSVRLVG